MSGTRADLFGWPEYVVFATMLLISAAIGIYFYRKGNKSTSEFLMGNRSLGVFPVSASLIASFISAITLLGLPAEIYLKGTQYWMIAPAYILVMLATGYIYLPVFFELQVTSANEYLELRFSKAVRQLSSFLFIVQMTVYMAIVVYAPSIALSQVTGLSVYGCVVAIFVICTFYTTVGGMKAVVWTDVFQVVIMFGAIIFVILKGAHDIGGHAAVWKIAEEGGRLEFLNLDLDPRTRHTVWGLIIGGYFNWVNGYGCNQAQVQRYLSLPTKRKVYWALFVNAIGLIAIVSICCYAGLVVYAKYATCDPMVSKQVQSADQMFPLFVMDILGEFPGVPGLFVAGIFSGSLSTVSSGLNSLAAIVLEDFIRGICSPNISEAASQKASKLIVVAFGFITFGLVFLAEQLGGILQASISICGILGGPLLGLFSLGMLFPWANALGAFAGAGVALVFTLWMGIGQYLAIANKELIIPNLPVSVEGCGGNFTTPIPLVEPESYGLLEFYRVSYIWYSVISCVLTVAVGLVLSLLSGCEKPQTVDQKLLSPPIARFVRWLYPNTSKSDQNIEKREKLHQSPETKLVTNGNASVNGSLSSVTPDESLPKVCKPDETNDAKKEIVELP